MIVRMYMQTHSHTYNTYTRQTKLNQKEREAEALDAQVKEIHQMRVLNEQLTTKVRR